MAGCALIDWALHLKLYQFTHWWHWLTYGANSAGLASLSSLVAALAASFAGYFAFHTYNTTVKQLDIVSKQYWDSRRAFLESVRPHLIVRVTQPKPRLLETPQIISVAVKNVGYGRAMNISGIRGITCSSFSLASQAEFDATVCLSTKHFAGPGSQTFFLYYSSIDGRRFRAETTVHEYVKIMNEEEVDISAGIEPLSFEDIHRETKPVQ